VCNPDSDAKTFNDLRFWLSPEAHPSLSLSSADKLIQKYVDQIICKNEIAIAYPCLSCLGGLSLFLAYMILSVETDTPGRPITPILVYPGTVEIREAYMALKIRIDDLLDGLRQIRIRAFQRGGSPRVYHWERLLLKKIERGYIKKEDEYPLHDFFPAAVIDRHSGTRLLVGRHGLGRGDDSPPPLQFSTRIDWLPEEARFKAAFIMHDALNTHAERKRLRTHIGKIGVQSLIHLFESPYSPNFRSLKRKDCKYWRIKSRDFPNDGKMFLEDEEILNMIDTKPRVHNIPPSLQKDLYLKLFQNLRQLRKNAIENKEIRFSKKLQ